MYQLNELKSGTSQKDTFDRRRDRPTRVDPCFTRQPTSPVTSPWVMLTPDRGFPEIFACASLCRSQPTRTETKLSVSRKPRTRWRNIEIKQYTHKRFHLVSPKRAASDQFEAPIAGSGWGEHQGPATRRALRPGRKVGRVETGRTVM